MSESRDLVVMVAGATGLIGTELIKQMLEEDPVTRIYALSRRELPFFHPKLEVLQNKQLQVQEWDADKPSPKYGFICLGTTIKQAGSKQELERIDYELVCDVAQTMKVLGVTHLAVVSSYGASVRSLSHYLRCKGKMEMAIERLGFEHITFVRPGPLVGLRDTPRTDEAIVQVVLKSLRPLMFGKLAKLIPIQASEVAKAMQYGILTKTDRKLQTLDSIQMRNLINKYQ
ncbi:NAD(P)H-binding protein [Vibrio coralliilyticus]|uniref:NAD(P)H-binding protein n=1 Tax=Vibrio coralliilyticus TaxID=190893 RepID=UPI00148C0D26|nr:NAD(P)H-binding protein [Vibrio coralliilyticus]NOH54099.1 NAD(P)H-binding protein [Vibrio coralliilyticus]NRF25638.1 NAD(P)H-binding protein [Vibrio coralliilyticus]NRF79734.1 NAD(P)H-binding protein [Vibrio coralliilyticus]NUW67271.1 NAD(P)H-binding protein [Vibrio coralliilyticus]WFB46852.1 NAD(P)H-binding protein [Vibrio coralliilyticus]